tara:strand:+ start:366 stop:923 length:558 start_codon:yes stop_codon:yes gene_type:complete
MAYRMKMTAAEKAKQAKQNQRQRNQNRDDFRKSRDEKGAAARQRRKEAQEKARKVREKREAQMRARREQAGYGRASNQMAREVANNEKPGFEGRANRFIDKATDGIGDAIRSGASAIGIDSDFDTGRMKARKEIKGYKKGGMAKKKPVKKNMGGMMKYNKGGKVRGAGKVMKGVRAATMVSMKGS